MFRESRSSTFPDTLNTNSLHTNTNPVNSIGYGLELDTRQLSGLNLQDRSSLSSGLADGTIQNKNAQAVGYTSRTIHTNGSISTATIWGNLNGLYSYSDSIGGSDINEYYKFSLNNRSDFNLVMSGLSADADIRLLDSFGNVVKASTNQGTHNIGGNAYSVSTSEAFNVSLNAGSYYLKVSSFDSLSTNYKIELLVKQSTSTPDWYSQNLKDSGIANWTRQFYNDGQFNRNEIMTIFRSALHDGSVNANEINDLRTIINSFSMPDDVKNLSTKVVFGSSANASYQGETLGNLVVGSTATQLDKLIGKWFLGNDLPSIYIPANGGTAAKRITYELANTIGLSGRNQILFGQDSNSSLINVSPTDIKQGVLGDCYFLASLGAFASNSQRGANVINNMFTDNSDGTFTVRFYGQNDGKVTTGADYVTVNQYLPSGLAAYDNQNKGLWVALAEKAYAQFAEIGTSQRQKPANNYGSIEGGFGYRVMNAITGVTQGGFYSNKYLTLGSAKSQGSILSLSDISMSLNLGWVMTAGTIQNPGQGIVGKHEYTILSANTSNGTLTLYNPWSSTRQGEVSGFRVISYDDFRNNFDMINVG